MSLSSDLWKLREKRLLEEKLKEQKSEEIAPVKTVTEEKAQDDSWVKSSGVWDDGYQFGDILKTGWSSARDVAQNILGGVLEIGEKVVDAGAYLGGLFSYYNPVTRMLNPDIAEENKKKTEEFIKSDLYDGTEVIKSISNEDLVKQIIGVGTEEASVFGEKSDSLAQSGGQLLGTIGLQAVGVPWWLTSGVTSFGSEVDNSLNQGASYEVAGVTAAVSAGAEILTEKLFGGSGLGEKGLINVDPLTRGISNKFFKALADYGVDLAAEGTEEVATDLINNFASALYKEENPWELITNEEAIEGYIDSFFGGMILGGTMNSAKFVSSAKNGTDYRSELTQNEQKVVEKVYNDALAEKDGKISNSEKSKLWNEVVEKMGRGEISTDTIEEVLGDKTYKDYKNTIETEESVMKELEELYEGDELQQQIDDILNNSNRFQIKNQLSNEVSELVKGDRLSESYNEKANRSRQFEADVTKYDPKHRDTIQKAIDSGILNNTRKTHEFVDIIAKISADKGVSFDFLNNQKLKESGFAVDGKQVNGLVTESGISINIDSPKAWQSTVGHEITHVLEGTDVYDALQQTLFDYAKSRKGTDSKFDSEYKERLYNTRQLYKDVKGYEGVDGFTKIKNEVTADLVGDYLFTDEKFIKHLSAKNRNVFEKIYDEIKYLCKVATAGSKEARELEKVKKAFEDAYRASGNKGADTKYSLGYHAGDLGKSEGHHMQGGGRSTGHFGTGTYFVSNPKALDGYNTRNGKPAPVEKVNLDNYNLYRIYSDEVGLKLHRNLQVLDGGVSQEFLDAARRDAYSASDLRRKANELADSYDNEVWNEDLGDFFSEDYFGAHIRAYTETLQENGVEFQSFEEWYNEYSGESPTAEDYENYQIDYYDYLKDTIAEADENRNTGYPAFRNAYFDLWMRFGKKQTDAALQNVVDHINKLRPDGEYNYDLEYGQDSNATVFMKSLGYEGINVSGTGLDNTTYGSVVYDLKGEDLARKKEIGTAKYSISDSTGKKLSKEQQEYFKDSKMRDENGNLKVMYHGSKHAGFHVFDAQMSDDDISFFFTDSNEVASSYSRSKEVYEARTFHTAKDMNKFLAEIGYEDYEVVKSGGKYTLYYDVDEAVATSDNLKDLYDEFCDYAGVGEGEGNYKVYLNLKNPLVVDAEGRNWDNVSLEFYPELYEQWKNDYFTEEEKAALVDLAGWEDYSTFKAEVERAVRDANKSTADEYTKAINSAFWKHSDVSSLFSIASDNFSDDVLKAEALKQMDTRDYAQKAKAEGYDGVIFKNLVDIGEYGRGRTPSTVAIAFESNQIKSTANAKPTKDADIRYSVSEVTDAQNENGLDARSEVSFSLSKDSVYMDNAIAKNNSSMTVDRNVMTEAKAIRERIAARMNQIKDRGLVGLPEDMEGNTYIANSSYDGTEENTTICPRSLASEAFVDAVSEYLGRPLTVEEQIYISQDLQGRSLTPECTYCYVATDRKAYRAFLGEYVNQRDAVLQKLSDNPNADVSRSGELYKEFLNGRKDTSPMYSRFKMWVDAYQNGTPMVEANHLANINKLMGDLKEFGDALKPQIVDAMKYAQSASWAKKRVNYVAYNGHILNWKQDRINKLNSHYGLRMYSFSDFHPAFVLENMQMITDASVRGLKMLGYTKDTDFVEIFAPSGMNINVSTFGFESGGNVYENNIIGAEWEKAKALREQYPNVGITFVATNDTLVNWALEQDWIDVVIPYHLVRTGAEVAKAFNYTNYTSESADTKTKDWAKGDKKYIAPTEHNNDLATYLAALEKNHLKPRFERFIDNPNYMKLVNECRQPASVSKPVQPVFNEEAAMKALAKLEANGYYQPIGGSVDRMYEIAAEVAEGMTKELAPVASLSTEGEQTNYGKYSTPANELRYEAPVQNVAPVVENSVTKDSNVAEATDLFPDDLAPMDESTENERLASITDEDAPVEAEAPYYEDAPVAPRDPFEERDFKGVGKRDVHAYMYDNPEVKPYFQMQAKAMLGDLQNSVKGERWYNDDVYYESGGEYGWSGTERQTTDDIAYLLDMGYTYAQIEKGLNAIIEDNGAENIAMAKRIEFALNERLMKGYTDINGVEIPANEEYLNVLAQKEKAESVEGQIAPHTDVDAPVDVASDDFDSRVDGIVKSLTKLKRNRRILVDGYSVGVYTRNGSDDVTISIKKPDGKIIGGSLTDGKYWTNTQLAREIAEQIAEAEGYVANNEDIAPVAEKPVEEQPKTEQKVAKVKVNEEVNTKKTIGTKVREALDNTKKTVNTAVSTFGDKGWVFENLSKKTKNRELEAKYNFLHYSESRAQEYIKDNLMPIVEQVKQTGKTEDVFNYVYHLHNIDRMSLESDENRIKRESLRENFKGLTDKQIENIAMEWIKKDTPKGVKKRIKLAREYIDSKKGMNKPVFGESVTADVSREAVKKYEAENPEFKELEGAIVEYNRQLRKMLVDGNVISQETADMWEKMYPHYVPIRRSGKDGLGVTVPLDTNKTGVNAPIKRATGGDSDIEDLFETMVMRTEQTFKAIAKNSFGVELMHTLDSNAAKEQTTLDKILDSFDSHEDLLQEGKNGKSPTFTVFEDGKRVTFDITKEMYDALKPTSENLAKTYKIPNKLSNIHRGLLTDKNPVFLATNAIKDVQDVMLNSQHAGKTYINFPVAIKELASHGHWYKEYMANGGEQNTYFDSDSKTFKGEKKGVKKWLNAISAANNFIERIPRLAEYIASRKSKRSIEVSMLDAARVTTNFAAGADVTKFLNRNGFTFLNASVQGAMQQARNIREANSNGLRGWAVLAGKVAGVGLAHTVLNHLLWDDDEDYEELSDYVKQNYYIVAKTDDGKFIRIPKGRTMAVIQDAFTQMEKLITGDDEVDLKNFAELVIANLAPNNPLENNILAPVIQVATNKTWYGEDLVPTRLQDVPNAEQYDESIDWFSKWLGEQTDFSPYKINYLLNQYSGGIGDVFLPMMTPEAENGDSVLGQFVAPWKDKFSTDSVMKNQNVSDFYDKVDELTVNANSSKATDEDVLKYKYINSINADLSELYQQKREIQNSDLADDEKYAQVREIQQQIDNLTREGLNSYEDVSVEENYATVADRHYRWHEPGEDSEAEAGWQKITEKQLAKQEKVTSGLNISPNEYWGNKEEYDYAYDNPEKYAVAKSVGGYKTFKTYSSELYDIKADKDGDGKSISGSRKEKVINYVNGLDIDYGQKIILFKSEYKSDNTYNYDIVDYLNSRDDISYDEMVTILKELGFQVSSDGYVTW
jgi:hypothetical protein